MTKMALALVSLTAYTQVQSRTIPIPRGVDAGTEIPVTTIRGAKAGPTLALIAGNHGYEYTPILALQKLRIGIDPTRLSGTVILVHVANMPSFLGRTIYFSPVDGKNLNRVYPGRPDGTVSERIAYALTKEVIEKADYVLDLHCGDGNESLRPYVYQMVTGNQQLDDSMAQLALAFGLDHIVLDRGRPTDPAKSIYCSTTATTRGKPALTVESGFLGTTDPKSIDQITAGVTSVMRYLKMMDGAPLHVSKLVYIDPAEVLTAPATGILYPHVERDASVRKGDLLAHITDFYGKELAQVRAPFDGIVLYIIGTPPITKDQPVAFIGSVRQTPSASTAPR
jgi:predicted deacylase